MAPRRGQGRRLFDTDAKLASPLIKDFEAAFPGVKVEYTDLNSTEVYNRFISENAANANLGRRGVELGDGLQMKLAADGLAMSYKSPESATLPAWARWKDSVYATTFEPIAIVYNKRLVPPEDVPKTHADFVKLLNTKAEKYQKKVTSYDAEKSGVGFMLVNQDAKLNPAFWDLVKAMAPRARSRAPAQMERVLGENLIATHPGLVCVTRARRPSSSSPSPRLQPGAVQLCSCPRRELLPCNSGSLSLSKRGQTCPSSRLYRFAPHTARIPASCQDSVRVKPIAVNASSAGLDRPSARIPSSGRRRCVG